MSNHFPTPPDSRYSLVKVAYNGAYPYGVTNDPINFSGFAVDGVDANGQYFYSYNYPFFYPLTVNFYFQTPGDPGAFDQDAAESQIAGCLDNLATMLATLNGVSLETAQGWFAVNREWTWQDSSGQYTMTYGDTMTYPAS